MVERLGEVADALGGRAERAGQVLEHAGGNEGAERVPALGRLVTVETEHLALQRRHDLHQPAGIDRVGAEDRKSTRLNSSHVKISYAVFCLKKKIIII